MLEPLAGGLLHCCPPCLGQALEMRKQALLENRMVTPPVTARFDPGEDDDGITITEAAAAASAPSGPG